MQSHIYYELCVVKAWVINFIKWYIKMFMDYEMRDTKREKAICLAMWPFPAEIEQFEHESK